MSFISEKFKRTVDGAIGDINTIDKTLTKLFKLEEKEAKEDEKERKRKDSERRKLQRSEKRKAADSNILKKITKKKEDEEEQGGLMAVLSKALGPLMGILTGLGGLLAAALSPLLGALGAGLVGALGTLGNVIGGALSGLWGLLKPALGGLGKSLLSVAKFLKLGPAALGLVGFLAGTGLTLVGLKWVHDTVRNHFTGGATASSIHDELNARLRAANMNMQGQAGSYRGPGNGRFFGGGGKARTAEQEAAYQEVVEAREELNRIKDEKDRLRKERDAAIDGVPKSGKRPGRGGNNQAIHTPEERQMVADIKAEYEKKIEKVDEGLQDLMIKLGMVSAETTIDQDLDPHPTALQQGGFVQKLQNGGFVVPGHGHGDQFYTRVPQGSFVLNRNAVAAGRAMGMFQEGGAPTMQDVVLEPGEMVFSPGQWENKGIEKLNKDFKRFQSGGHVSIATEHIKKDEALSSLTPGENDYIKPGGFSVRSNTPWGDIHGDTKLHAYKDSVGVATIGWGNTYYDSIRAGTEPVKMGDTITKKKADNIMLTNVGALANDYATEIPNWDKMSDSQKAGLLSMGYNAPNFFTSDSFAPKLKKALLSGDMAAAADNLSWGGPSATRIGESQAMLRQGPTDLTQVKKPAAAPKPAKENKEPEKKGGNMFTNMVDGIRNFMGFQEGGQTPQQEVVLEPGEMVFDKATPELMALNSKFKRFQSGGLVQANHPDTGEGWSVGKDSYGRPSVLSKSAGEAFLKAMKASKGKVKTSDITSSTRSPAKNKAVGGVPNSNHLYGNALDIHGTSKVWLKEHGPKYGWKNLVYSGHDGHFDFTGGGEKIVPGDGGEKTAEDATPQSGNSTDADLSGIVPGNSGDSIGGISFAGVGTYIKEFMGGIGEYMQDGIGDLIGGKGGSDMLTPTSDSQKTGSDLVDKSDKADESSSGSDTVVVNLPDSGGETGQLSSDGSLNTTVPVLPSGPSSAAAADYYFTVNMCV